MDVFAAIKELLNIKSACMTGTCTPCMGVKPGGLGEFEAFGFGIFMIEVVNTFVLGASVVVCAEAV